MTKRSYKKKVWPGVWTNSLCGHPDPGENMEAAILRRAGYELGIKNIDKLKCVIREYFYKTPSYDGIIEHEFCPIYVGYTEDDVILNPDEVESYQWIKWSDYVEKLRIQPEIMSYWAKDQYSKLKPVNPFKRMGIRDNTE